MQEENFQETEQQSNVNEVQESVSEDEEVQMQESTIESSEVESEIASELDNTVEESTSELDTTSASEVDNDLLQKMYEYAQIYNDANGAPEGDSLACEQYAALEQYPDNGIMVINNNEISVSAYISKLLSKVEKAIVRQIEIQRIILIAAHWLKDVSVNWELPMCLVQPLVGIVH